MNYIIRILILSMVIYPIYMSSSFAGCDGKPSKCSGLNQEDCKKRNDFKKSLCSLMTEVEKMQTMTSADIKRFLGDSEDYSDQDDSIRINNQGEMLTYSDPVSASVRYIFIFNKDGFLRLEASAQVLEPTAESVFFPLDAFVE